VKAQKQKAVLAMQAQKHQQRLMQDAQGGSRVWPSLTRRRPAISSWRTTKPYRRFDLCPRKSNSPMTSKAPGRSRGRGPAGRMSHTIRHFPRPHRRFVSANHEADLAEEIAARHEAEAWDGKLQRCPCCGAAAEWHDHPGFVQIACSASCAAWWLRAICTMPPNLE